MSIRETIDQLNSGNPMNQIFIANYLIKASEAVLSSSEPPEDWPSIINWDAWKRSAKEIKEAFDGIQ